MKCWHGCVLLGLLACYGSIYHSIIFRFYDQSRNLSLSVWMHMPLCTLLWNCIVPCRPFLFHGACCNTSYTFSIQRLIRSSRSKSIRIEYNQAYMAMVPSDSSHHGVVDNSPNGCTQARCGEARKFGPSWYFSRKELEENSPSRRDGIDFKKESNLRKLYCKFLQELGIALKM